MRRIVAAILLAFSLASCGQPQEYNVNAPVPTPVSVRKYVDPETGTSCYLYGSEIDCVGRNEEGQ